MIRTTEKHSLRLFKITLKIVAFHPFIDLTERMIQSFHIRWCFHRKNVSSVKRVTDDRETQGMNRANGLCREETIKVRQVSPVELRIQFWLEKTCYLRLV